MTRNEMINRWRWLLSRGDHEAAKEVAYDFYEVYGESIYEYA